MSTVPSKYQPSQRLIDNPTRLAELRQQGLSIREIADEHASVSVARVHQALKEYGLTDSQNQSRRGRDPPSTASATVSWEQLA